MGALFITLSAAISTFNKLSNTSGSDTFDGIQIALSPNDSLLAEAKALATEQTVDTSHACLVIATEKAIDVSSFSGIGPIALLRTCPASSLQSPQYNAGLCEEAGLSFLANGKGYSILTLDNSYRIVSCLIVHTAVIESDSTSEEHVIYDTALYGVTDQGLSQLYHYTFAQPESESQEIATPTYDISSSCWIISLPDPGIQPRPYNSGNAAPKASSLTYGVFSCI